MSEPCEWGPEVVASQLAVDAPGINDRESDGEPRLAQGRGPLSLLAAAARRAARCSSEVWGEGAGTVAT